MGEEASKTRLVLLFGLLVAVLAGVPSEARAEIQPHRALYSLKMKTVTPGSGVTGIEGFMRFAMERTCDGWILGQDINISINVAIGETINDHYRFASFEALSGNKYDFVITDRSDSGIENIRGNANKKASGGVASFRDPEKKTFPLGRSTLFPIEHMALLIEEAKTKKHQVSSMVFDGTKVGGAQRVVTFVGNPKKIKKELVEKLGSLVARPGWTMRLAYFSGDRGDGAPEVEVEGYQLDNGVSPTILVDYGAFTALMEMTSVEAIAQPDCS